MHTFLVRLSSRKFLLAVGIVITACANHQYVAAAAAGIGYLTAEGAIDIRAINTAGQVESRAHDLAIQLLNELDAHPTSATPPARRRDDPRQGLPLKGDRPPMTEPARPSPIGRVKKASR